MEISDLELLVGKLVSIQLRTPWFALQYARTEGAMHLADAALQQKRDEYGKPMFDPSGKPIADAVGPLPVLANVKIVKHTSYGSSSYAIQQRGPDGTVTEIFCHHDEIVFATEIVEHQVIERPQQARIITP